MIYKHQYFELDTESKKVIDENYKKLVLTGNAYRLLAYLCGKKNATLTDINEYFDPAEAKDYTENHIRQYRYKINSVVGYNIIAYKNNIYSINGEVSIKTFRQKRWKFSKKEKIVNLLLIVILIIFSAVVLRNKNGNSITLTKSKSLDETAKNSGRNIQNDMVLIPAGEFLMGSTEEQALEAWRQNDGDWRKEDYLSEYPQRRILLDDFYIDRKEVSNNDYRAFVDATGHAAPSLWNDQTLNMPNQPVVGVDWNDADVFCQWVGKRLPTEAEWEKAARGTDGRIWSWGNDWILTKDNHGKGSGYGFDESDGYKYTAPVGVELGVSPYKVLNIAGNVYEWIADDFNSYPGNDKYIQADFNKGFKVLKGGAYTDGRSEQRPASRSGYQKDYKDVDVGFRCVKNK